ncbi:MAG TPA: hypothetical protein VLA72_11490, partial [Anaerolineales bacterium]|nr:hypothetical protein [Anaerolineales bacterium]
MKFERSKPVYIVVLFVDFGILVGYFLISRRIYEVSSTSTPEYALTNVWSSLLEVTPVSYTTPHPDSNPSPLDGTYAKYDPNWLQWWSCLRCADYRPACGAWRLQFDKGIMRIYYEVTGWNSLASYVVSDDRLFLFNDPYCRDAIGEYQWKLKDGNLILETIQDSCSFQLRGRNLSGQSWEMCASSDGEKTHGCEDPVVEANLVLTPSDEFTVTVHQGDVRLFSVQPDVYVNASGEDISTPDDILISFSDGSILFGNNRVLWTDNNWIEIETNGSYTSMGVQFRGDHVIGWAHIL